MAKGRKENLIPQNQRTKEAQREIARKGAAASNKKQKEKRLLKDTIAMMLEMKAPDETKQKFLKDLGINAETIQDLITGGLMGKAMSGDAKAFEVIRDSIGQKPVEVVKTTNVNTDATIEELKTFFNE